MQQKRQTNAYIVTYFPKLHFVVEDEGADLQDNIQLDHNATELKPRSEQWQREGELRGGAGGTKNLSTGDITIKRCR